MQKSIYTLFIFLISVNSLFAQHDKREKLKAYKAAYLTQQLDLSSKEAEKFWPVYNDYENKLFQLKVLKVKETREKVKVKGGIDALNESEANQILLKLNENDQAIIDTKKELYANLKKIISSKKILKLHRAEHEFNRKLLSDYRKKKHMNYNR